MFKSFFLSIVFLAIIFSGVILSQESHSFQVNGGIISPVNSSKGLVGLIQFNYSLNPQFIFYLYSGYSTWDQYVVNFKENGTAIQKRFDFSSYSSDDHKLIPVYFGSRINVHTDKLFTLYLNFELGYSYLTYQSYKNLKSVNPETGEILGYYVDQSTRKEMRENLFGVGIGAGLSHPITSNSSAIISAKLNSFLNSNNYGLLSARGTYLMVLAGFNFSI